MLGLKLNNIAEEIYIQSLQRMNESNIPCTLQMVVMENVLSRFRDNALSAASQRAVTFEEELRDLRREETADKKIPGGETDGGYHEGDQ